MPDFIKKWIVDMAMKELQKVLNAGKLKELEAALIKEMRLLAKTKTPDFPYDDQVVEMLAKALGVA